MGITFDVVYHELVLREDIPKLSQENKKRIKKAIENKIVVSPDVFGKPLRRSLKGYRKLRVGDYRIIFRIEKTMIKIFCIAHRSSIYKNIDDRL